MASTSSPPAVRGWLLAVAALMLATLLVGGATRLTESGLSIVEWRPVTGIVPPLDRGRMAGRVRQIQDDPAIPRAQSRHEPRRVQDHLLVGVVASAAGAPDRRGIPAAVPVVPVARRDRAPPALRLWTIFGLGAALGAVGWWMVSSGLAERVNVSQYRLGFHLTLACVIYAMVLWTAQQLVARDPPACRLGFAPAPSGSRARAGANLSGRAGRRPARRAHLQHLAADRRQHRARCVAAVLPRAAVAESSSRMRSPCSSITA